MSSSGSPATHKIDRHVPAAGDSRRFSEAGVVNMDRYTKGDAWRLRVSILETTTGLTELSIGYFCESLMLILPARRKTGLKHRHQRSSYQLLRKRLTSRYESEQLVDNAVARVEPGRNRLTLIAFPHKPELPEHERWNQGKPPVAPLLHIKIATLRRISQRPDRIAPLMPDHLVMGGKAPLTRWNV
jgi:hypothetical protein